VRMEGARKRSGSIRLQVERLMDSWCHDWYSEHAHPAFGRGMHNENFWIDRWLLLFSHVLLMYFSILFPCEHMVANNLDSIARYTFYSANVIMFKIEDKWDWTWPSPNFKFTQYTVVCLIATQ
jgi:hypothetical protein